jgi:amino acid transporter
MTEPGLKRVLTLTDVALFNIVVVFSLRGMATAAKIGPLAMVLWLLAVGAFFVPLALTVSELASRDPGEGGFYRWVRAAFGDAAGFTAGWFYWLSNLTYLPSLLIFLAANVGYVAARPELEDNAWFVTALALGVLWFAAWLNIRGLTLGRLVTNFGAVAAFGAALLLIAAGATALARYGSATDWSSISLDALGGGRALGWIGTLSLALVGLELSALMGGEIREPRRTIPRAIALAGAMIAVLYVLGTAAILVAVPAEVVSPISGVAGAVQAVGARAGWTFLPVVTAVLVSVSVVAGFTAWLGGMARLPYAVGLDRFLPRQLAQLHPVHRTPARAILLQTVLTTLFVVASQAGATVREAYVVLLDTTIVLNFVPFLFIFLALPRLRPVGEEEGVARIPGGRGVLWAVALAGLLTTLVTLISAVVPTVDAGNVLLFEAKLWGGLLVFGAVGLVIFRRYRRGSGQERA